MEKIKANLRVIVNNINLPTVLKTAVLPGEMFERLFIATQIGEIYYIGEGGLEPFLDIRSRVLKLGTNGGYDERGLLGLAFHPDFSLNGLFYLHYSVAGSQGVGALRSFKPNPCEVQSLNLKWDNRDTEYDHIDTVEEWMYLANGQSQKRRTLLNIRRPFFNHNGVNSLNFSPETNKLILTTGDGGSAYDPFNLAQDDSEIAGKIIEIDIDNYPFINNNNVITRFNELPIPVQECLSVIAKGVRNISGITFQKNYNQYIKYVGNVGQDLVESIFSFINYKPVPVIDIVQGKLINQDEIINLGWRGWEGALPTLIIRNCPSNSDLNEKVLPYFYDTVNTSTKRISPLTSYYHQDPRPNRLSGTALTGVKVYMGKGIPSLTGSVVFSDWLRKGSNKGFLGYTRFNFDCKLNDFGIIEINDFMSKPNFYVSLGTTLDQTRLFLGTYSSPNVTNLNQGTVYEVIL